MKKIKYLWFEGFIEESIIAYQNSQNQLSCSKGVKERILTGLRGVDVELDNTFKYAEAPLLMKNYINTQYNVHDETVQQRIIAMLNEKDIEQQSPLNDAQLVLYKDMMLKLHQYGVEIPGDIKESAILVTIIFGDIYDANIRPFLKQKFFFSKLSRLDKLRFVLSLFVVIRTLYEYYFKFDFHDS